MIRAFFYCQLKHRFLTTPCFVRNDNNIDNAYNLIVISSARDPCFNYSK